DGQITVWCCTQGAFPVRQQCAEILNHPISQVKVIPTEIGGGFGGKISVYLEPVAAGLWEKGGRPRNEGMQRGEAVMAARPAPRGAWVQVKMGVDESGKIVAAQATIAFDAGAYPGSPISAGVITAFAPYDLANVRIDGYDVVVNKPKSNAYRAPGATISEFAV